LSGNWINALSISRRSERGNTEMAHTEGQTRLAVLGAGKMGGILIEAFVKQGIVSAKDISATVQRTGVDRKTLGGLPITLGTDNRAAVRDADVILLCVKPHFIGQVVEQIKPDLSAEKLLISVAAAVPTEYIERRAGANIPVIRAMPNTPAMVGAGITALAKGKFATQKDVDTARKLFDAVGTTVVADEKNMDAITGLSGSGPAYIYIILESLAEGGVKMGLPRDLATKLAAQTALGAAKMVLETGQHPAILKDMVTTPAGCTVAGIFELEEGGVRVALINAVVKAAKRAKELLVKDEA
jgi:pyrroline-5-carboxylate reductase